jgi:hypothetical protein
LKKWRLLEDGLRNYLENSLFACFSEENDRIKSSTSQAFAALILLDSGHSDSKKIIQKVSKVFGDSRNVVAGYEILRFIFEECDAEVFRSEAETVATWLLSGLRSHDMYSFNS